MAGVPFTSSSQKRQTGLDEIEPVQSEVESGESFMCRSTRCTSDASISCGVSDECVPDDVPENVPQYLPFIV